MLATRPLQLLFFLFSIFALAFADLTPSRTTTVTITPSATPTSVCSTGSAQCCDTVESASSSGVAAILALLGIVLGDLGIDVGLDCSPIDILGLGTSDCNQNAVCCEDNSHGNLISIGCIPITL